MATNVIYQYGNQAGPVSKFQAFIGLRIAETSATAYRLEYNHAIWACSGANFEGTTVKYEYWLNGSCISASSVKLYGSGWYADNGWNNLGWYNIGSSVALGSWAGYTGGSGTSYSSNSDGSYAVPGYYLDVNGLLDGSDVGNTAGYGTFNVAINGSTVSSNITDFYTAYTPSTTYSISNIQATTGHTYNGVSSGSLSGTINGTTSVRLKFTTDTYTITYDANGGTGAPDSQTYTYASSGTVALSSAVPTRTGYTFKGWATSSTATSATYAIGGAFNKSTASNTTLYAVWSANTYIIEYNTNGGTGAPTSQEYIYASSGTVTLSSTIPTRKNYEFLGWATSPSATSATYLAGGLFNKNVASDTILYAVWAVAKWCYLAYDANGGSCAIESQIHYSGEVSDVSNIKPTRDGYSFSGWSHDAMARKAKYLVGGKYIHDDFDNESVVTLYAVWRKIINLKFKLPDES